MPLKAVVEDIEQVDEGLRDFYKEADDGYVLDVEPFEADNKRVALEDVHGLRTALQNERATKRDLESKFKQYKDIDPDTYRQAIEELETLKESTDTKSIEEKAEEIAQRKISQVVKKHEQEKQALDGKANTYKGQLEQLMVDRAAAEAINNAGGDNRTAKLLMPHIKDQVQLRESDGQFIVDVVDPSSGHPRIGDSQGNPMTLEELVNEMKSSDIFSSAFPGSGKSGGGTPSSGKGGAGVPKRKSEFTSAQRADFIDKNGAMAWVDLPD